MDKVSFDEVIKEIGLILGLIKELPTEDFIKQLNVMLKSDKFGKYSRDSISQLSMLSGTLLNIKSSAFIYDIIAFQEI